MKKRNKIWKGIGITLGTLVLLLIGFSILIQRPGFQTFVANKIIRNLSKKLDTKVSLESLDFSFFNKIALEGLYIEDKKGDTLLFVDKVNSNIDLFKPFRNKFELSNSKLEGLKVYINQSPQDSLNTMQAIFGGNTEGPSGKKKKKPLQLGFKDVELKDILFISDDKKNGKRSKIDLPEGIIDFTQFNLEKKKIAAKSIELNDVYIDLYTASNGTPNPDSIAFFLPEEWTIKSNSLEIDNGRFANKTANKPANREDDFSFSDFDLDNLYITGKNLELKDQVLNLDIEPLRFVDKTGFRVDKLVAKTRIAPDGIQLKNLLLKTPNSNVIGDAELGFLNLAHFSNFNEYIDLDINFEDAVIHPKTLEYFFARSPLDESISVKGKFTGQVANLQTENLDLRFENGTVLKGNIDAIGLPDINNTFFDADIRQFTTTPNGLQKIGRLHSVPEKVAQFSAINYNGKFTGFITDFVAYGDINTNLGNLHADINYEAKKGNPSYSGALSTSNFELGKWLREESLGNVSFSTQVNGTGFDVETMSANFDGTIRSIEYNNNTITNLDAKGNFSNNVLSGLLALSDNDIKGTFDGSVDFKGERPYFDVKSDLQKADLYALGLVKEPLSFDAAIHADIKGTNLQDIIGDIDAKNLRLTRADATSTFSELGARLEKIDGEQVLNLTSEKVSASFTGNYDITQLLPTLKNTLNNYYDFEKGWENETHIIKSSAPIGFALDIKGNDDLTKFLFPEITLTSGIVAQGELLPDKAQIDITASADELVYGKYSLEDWSLTAIGDGTNLHAVSTQNNLKNADALWLDNSEITLDIGRDNIVANVKSLNNDFLNADITGSIERNGDRFTVSILDSDLEINNETWTVGENNSVTIGKKYWAAENFIIRNKDQEIEIRNPTQDLNTKLIADISNIKLADLNQFISFTAKPFNGDLNGSISLVERNNTNDLDVSLTITNLMYNNDLAEIAVIDGTFQPNSNVGIFEGIVSGSEFDMGLQAQIDLNEGANLLDLNLNINRASVSPFGNLWAASIENTTGYVNGDLNIYGGPINFNLSGDISLATDVNTTLKFTQAKYTLPRGQKIRIVEDAFLIDDLILSDPYGNIAEVNGIIEHDFLKDFYLNVSANTDKLLFLETTPLDNSTFYGTAFAGGNIGFTGPVTDVLMTVDAFSQDNTDITIKAGSAQNTTQYSFITFKEAIDSTENNENVTKKKAKPSKLTMDFNLEVGPEANMTLLFDDEGLNVVKGNGYSDNLNIIYDTEGRFEMTGVYTINKGSYGLNLNNFVDEEFILAQGGQIQWSGNPYDARLSITGEYTTDADINALFGESSLTSESAVDVSATAIITIGGTIAQPMLSYEITADTNGQASELIRQINEDKRLVEAQVANLLVFKSFMPMDSSPFDLNINEVAINTVSNIIVKQFSYLLSGLGVFDDISVDYTDRNFNEDPNVPGTGTLGVKIREQILEGKVIVEFGGDFNFGDLEQANLSAVSIGDIVIYVLLNESGNVRLKMFDRKDFLNYQANERRRGFGFYFRKEFNSFSDLFKKEQNNQRRKKLKKDKSEAKEEDGKQQSIGEDDTPE